MRGRGKTRESFTAFDQRTRNLAILATLVSVAIFLIDLRTPLGIADASSYVLVILLTLWMQGNFHTLLAIVLTAILTILGLYLSPPGENMYYAVSNRILALIGISTSGIVVFAYKRIMTRNEAQRESLEALAKRLQDANAELESFNYVASHDLQEPLRKISAFSERIALADNENLSPSGKEYLQKIRESSARMSRLIQDLLSYSRMKDNPVTMVDLGSEINAVLSDLHMRIEGTGARIETGELPTITGDKTQMRQLFQNLLGNSLKFTREDVLPEIRISAKPSDKPGYYEFRVQDNGIGFDPRYADKVFGFFQRLEGKKYEGTGIGLAICKKIVNRHGGHIMAETEPGSGTTFVFTLPVAHVR